jgi:two-component system LytT family response regulator
MTMNCIAVDDEPLALRLLADNISKVAYLNLVATCANAFEAVKALEENAVDLIFIDIQMPGLTGLQFISTLQNKQLVIFITAYKQYALESYDLSVVEYLVKLVAIDRFIKACNRVKELHELKSFKHQPESITPKDFFFLSGDYSQVKIMFDDIIWMEGVRDYIKIHLKNAKTPLLFRTSLKAVEAELSPLKFIRIDKTYIVAIQNITAVRKGSVFVKEMELPIGETYRAAIENLLR